MFTGIIQDLVKIEKIRVNDLSRIKKTEFERNSVLYTEITINLKKFKKLKIGDSIAVNGVCLTIAKLNKKNRATFQIVDETIKRSSLSFLQNGDKVNVERSLRVGDRLEGHFVLGHVDCIGKITNVAKNVNDNRIYIEIEDKSVLYLIAQKGSITIDGISLTVVKIRGNEIEIALIPHTLENTTLGIKQTGDFVNVEADILARYLFNFYQNIGNNK
jgi:riboflavin synthase